LACNVDYDFIDNKIREILCENDDEEEKLLWNPQNGREDLKWR
jgi:hypothetical protein